MHLFVRQQATKIGGYSFFAFLQLNSFYAEKVRKRQPIMKVTTSLWHDAKIRNILQEYWSIFTLLQIILNF